VDTVPRGYVDNAIAAAKYFRHLRPVQNRPFDKQRSLFQIPWRTNIENDRRITPVEQPGDESPSEISGPSCQKHLHSLLRHLPLFASVPERLDEDELADWRAGRNAVYQLAALTVGERPAVADG